MRLLFGCGSGRCGTKSLSRLLQAQGAKVSHVMAHCPPGTGYPGFDLKLPWDGVDNPIFREAVFRICSRDGDVAGDVSPFWLNYVPLILAEYPDCRVICLQRERGKCIASLLEMQTGIGRNDFSEDVGEDTRAARLTPKFPLSREDATARFWDWYYTQAQLIQSAYSRRFRIYQTEMVLNNPHYQMGMLMWAGFDVPVVEPGIHCNTMVEIRAKRARKAAGLCESSG